MMDQSGAGSMDIFPRCTNQAQEAWVYSHTVLRWAASLVVGFRVTRVDAWQFPEAETESEQTMTDVAGTGRAPTVVAGTGRAPTVVPDTRAEAEKQGGQHWESCRRANLPNSTRGRRLPPPPEPLSSSFQRASDQAPKRKFGRLGLLLRLALGYGAPPQPYTLHVACMVEF
eukprot:1181697-Prorocentrum_minimum.AAC.1